MSIFLTTYQPLIHSQAGKQAAAKYGIPPFVDRSCRREPDFESVYPSITAICRGKIFAPRLSEGDIVVYLTKKDAYLSKEEVRHLVAVLQVVKRFETHEDAANWYRERNLPLPSNCMVPGNPPVEFDKTAPSRKVSSLRAWDAKYRLRVRDNPVFLICNPLYRELHNPPIITQEMLNLIFGKPPATRNPPKISPEQYQQLREIS